MLLGSNFVMHTKIASLWRFIRTPALLTSTTVLLISCASKNPLIDEVEQPNKEKSVVSATTDEKPFKIIDTDKSEPGKTQPVDTGTKTGLVSENENELNKQPEGMKKWISKLTPYKVDIQQGNFVSSEMLSRLKPGMTKEQVRFVLGTPLLTDMFHANRWDYLFRLQKPNGAITTNRVTVFFNENLVERIVNDHLPDEAEYLSHIAGDKVPTEKAKKSSSDEYKPAKKVSDISVSEPLSQTQMNSQPSGIPDEPVSTTPVITADPVSATDPVKVAEPVKAAEPVKVTEPVRTPERVGSPAQISQPEEPASVPQNAGESETATPSETTSVPDSTPVLKRPERIKRGQATTGEDEMSSPKDNVKTFEPISIPSRTGKMSPASPNDQLIGNIQ